VSEEFQDLLRAEMERVEASPRPDLVRDAHQTQRRRQQARRRAGLAATGCVAAVAAVATVLALQPGASRPSTSAATGSSAQAAAPVKVNLGGAGAAVQTTAVLVTATFTAETDTTAASVLDEAALASGSGNVQLVNGWPTAPYWHVLSQQTNASCPGQVITSNSWLGKDGTVVDGTEVAGPKSSDPTSSCSVSPTGYYPVGGTPAGVFIGGQLYSWAQFAALPTDPAKLWPLLEADANVGVAPGKGGVTWTYTTIVGALTSDPLSPAMRVALYKVMEKFPGVHVTGTYTDSLGRTGTAITFSAPNFGSITDVIDASTGQVLAQLDAAQPVPPGCVRATVGGEKGATCVVSGTDVQVFISAGPANTMPLHIARFAMPSIVGDSFKQAQRELTQVGIGSASLKGAKVPPGSTVPTGIVIAQSPAAGTMVTSETVPTLTLRS
jgi:PASTA domain